jgi:hypothetical protein
MNAYRHGNHNTRNIYRTSLGRDTDEHNQPPTACPRCDAVTACWWCHVSHKYNPTTGERFRAAHSDHSATDARLPRWMRRSRARAFVRLPGMLAAAAVALLRRHSPNLRTRSPRPHASNGPGDDVVPQPSTQD